LVGVSGRCEFLIPTRPLATDTVLCTL
jgi:hypothetical protein